MLELIFVRIFRYVRVIRGLALKDSRKSRRAGTLYSVVGNTYYLLLPSSVSNKKDPFEVPVCSWSVSPFLNKSFCFSLRYAVRLPISPALLLELLSYVLF